MDERGIPTDFERGQREGRVDALLEAHTKHLGKINGHIEQFTRVVDRLDKSTHAGFDKLEGAILSLQTEGRLAEERVNVAAITLAGETERRRAELAAAAEAKALASSGDFQRFTKRERRLAGLIAFATLLAYIWFSTH